MTDRYEGHSSLTRPDLAKRDLTGPVTTSTPCWRGAHRSCMGDLLDRNFAKIPCQCECHA